ncbi:MAG: UDP-N-acetylmuramate--L-alanine ligase [Candidatus Kerfeldbacteria bacterium]
MKLRDAKTIYFSGIGGIGTSALAQLLHAGGTAVSGSEIAESKVTEMLKQAGIAVNFIQDGSGITDNMDYFIYSGAVPEDHPERMKAAELGIPSMNYFQALGEYMMQFATRIAVSGTHGKTTTTAMLAQTLLAGGLDPTVIVGSIVKEFGSNARSGSRDLIIVEACEHQEHMLELSPTVIVLTNIEEEHLDYYRDMDHIRSAFQSYVGKLPEGGLLIANADDKEAAALASPAKRITFGIEQDADIKAEQIQAGDGVQAFTAGGAQYELRVPGTFNILNALPSIALGKHLELSEDTTRQALSGFTGVWRRFEILGEYRRATVVSDYAHHPTAVASTIDAARQLYPGRRVVVVFQPHQRSRTIKFFDQFADALARADYAVVQEIFDVAGREQERLEISSKQLCDALEQRGMFAAFSPNAEATREIIDDIIVKKDILLIMGAGDIYLLAQSLTD